MLYACWYLRWDHTSLSPFDFYILRQKPQNDMQSHSWTVFYVCHLKHAKTTIHRSQNLSIWTGPYMCLLLLLPMFCIDTIYSIHQVSSNMATITSNMANILHLNPFYMLANNKKKSQKRWAYIQTYSFSISICILARNFSISLLFSISEIRSEMKFTFRLQFACYFFHSSTFANVFNVLSYTTEMFATS